jgi:small subunit ribosomal protein S17
MLMAHRDVEGENMDTRGRLRFRVGEVVSDKMDKTVTVRVERLMKHPVYGRIVRRSIRLHAHDELNQCQIGDVVRVAETRPMSKTKRYRLVEILREGAEGRRLETVGGTE